MVEETLQLAKFRIQFNGEEIAGIFYEKELQKTNQEEFRLENAIKKKEINCMLNGNATIVLLIVALIKKTYKMSQYFPEPSVHFDRNVKFELGLSSYARKTNLKNAEGIGTSKLPLKSNLARSKEEIDKLDVDKLKTVVVDLSKLSNAVENEDVKKTVYNKSVTKVNNIDSSEFVLKALYDIDKSDLENKTCDVDEKILILVNLLKKQSIILKLLK